MGKRRMHCVHDRRLASDEVYVYSVCLLAVMVGFTSVRGL